LAKILGARREARSKFHTEGPQILGATVKNLLAPGDLVTGICTPLYIEGVPGGMDKTSRECSLC